MALAFKKAVKYDAKGRVALVGPAGSGKSWTMLTMARALVGPAGKIAAIDTEHGSLSKYADIFDFDVMELSSFRPDSFIESLKVAEVAGYDAFCCDSLSHFWVGKDGALEFVDMAAKRYKDNMGGWKEFRPHERAMVDAMIASPLHVLVTMRTKTEYQEQINPSTGKKQRVKVGLAPVQREGLEFEFDLVAYMDEENTFITDKTRCPYYSKKAITQPTDKDFAPFVQWLNGAALKQAPVPLAVHKAADTPPESNPTPASVDPEDQPGIIKNGKFQPLAAEPEIESTNINVVTIDSHKLGPDKYLYSITDEEGVAYTTFSATIYATCEEARIALKPLEIKFRRQPGKVGTKYEGKIFLNLVEAEYAALDSVKNH